MDISGPEMPTEQPVVAPGETPRQKAQEFLDQLAREVSRKNITARVEQVKFCKDYLSGLTQDRLDDLHVILRDRAAVPDSFRKIFAFDTPEYQEIIDATHLQLQTLRAAVLNTTKTAGGHIAKYSTGVADVVLGEERSKTWSKEQKVALGIGITLGAAAIAGLAAWFIAKGKDATSKARRAALAGAGILGTIGVFLGLKKLDSIYQHTEKAQELLRKSEEALAKTRREAEEATGKVKEELDRRIAEIEKVRTSLQEGKEPGANEENIIEESSLPVQPPEVVPVAEASKQEKILQVAKESGKEALQGGGSLAFAHSLVAFRDTQEWNIERDAKVQHVHDFLQGHLDLTMEKLFSGLSDDGSIREDILTIPSREKESRLQASQLVLHYCKERKDELLKHGKTEEEISSMRLRGYLPASAPGFTIAGAILNAVHTEKGDFVAAMHTIDLEALTKSDEGLQQELHAFAEESGDTSVDVKKILENLPTMTVTVSQYQVMDESKTDPVLRTLCARMQEDTHLYVLPFFRSLFPTRSWDADMQVNKEHVKDILYSKIPFHMAVRLYLYRRMIERGNPAGFLPMQAEVFAYFAKNDESFLSNKKYQLANRVAQVVAGGGWEEWEQVDISIDEELIRQATRNIGVVGKNVATATMKGLFKTAEESGGAYIGTGKEYPVLIGGVSTLVGGGWLLKRLYRFERNAAPDLVDQRLERAANNRMTRQQLVRAARSIEFSAQEWHTAHQTFHEMRELIRQMTTAGNAPGRQSLINIGWEFQEGLHRCTTASLENSASAWSRFVSSIEQYRGLDHTIDQFLHQVRAVRDTPSLRNIISIASRPVIGRVRRYADMVTAPLRGIESFVLRRSAVPKVNDLLRKISAAHAAGNVDDLRTLLRHDLFRDETVRALAARGDEGANLLLSFRNMEAEELLAQDLFAPEAARTSLNAADDVTESITDAAKVLDKVEEARRAGNHPEIGRLLTEYDDLLQAAAKQGDEAAEKVTKAAHFAKSSRIAKIGAGGLIGVGMAFDAWFILENEREIAEARKNNPTLVATLEARRKSLIAAGAGGALLEGGMYAAGVGGGAGLVLAAPVIGGAMYSEAIYDAVREWDKSEQEYLKEDSGTLLTSIREKMTERTRGTAAAHGDTMMGALWKKLAWSKEEREKHYQEKFNETDRGINLGQRQKLYAAYALKNARGENPKESARLQSNYVSMVSQSAFDALQSQELSEAEIYASLTMLRALKEKEGQPQTIIYLSTDGAEKTFDLSLFAFDGVPQTAEEKRQVSDAVAEYRNIVQPALLYTRFVLSMDYARSSDIHLDSLRASIRGDLVMRARHHLNKAEEYVRASDLSVHEKDIVRLELRKNFEDRVAAIIAAFEKGSMNPKQFSEALAKLEYAADEAKNAPREVLARSTSAIKIAMTRKAPSRDRRTLGEDDPVENAKRGEAKKLKIRRASDALLELAA